MHIDEIKIAYEYYIETFQKSKELFETLQANSNVYYETEPFNSNAEKQMSTNLLYLESISYFIKEIQELISQIDFELTESINIPQKNCKYDIEDEYDDNEDIWVSEKDNIADIYRK